MSNNECQPFAVRTCSVENQLLSMDEKYIIEGKENRGIGSIDISRWISNILAG